MHDSAETHRGGGITKQGRRDLRAAMAEATWVAVLHNAYWKARFEHLCRHLTREKAIVAIARQMLVAVWHVWHDREPDQHSDPTATARDDDLGRTGRESDASRSNGDPIFPAAIGSPWSGAGLDHVALRQP